MKIQLTPIIILFIIFSGCISPTQNGQKREIGSINTGDSLSIPRQQVISINYTQSKFILESKNYTFKNNSEGDIYVFIASKQLENKIRPKLVITIFSSLEETGIEGSYDSENPIPHSELEEKKEYVKEKIIEVAEICDLTVDIDQIEWVINYAD